MKTLPIILGILALVTGALAWWPGGERAATDLGKTGSVFGVEDAKPDQVASLRVATWDDETKAAKVFEVAKKDGAWVIPSQHDYPADGGTRVGRTAGGVLGVKRGRYVGNDAKQFKDLGLVDPITTDAAATDEGRGKRVTVKDLGGATLVDLIIGKTVTGGEGNFVREADSNEVFTAKVNSDISTKFIDWVEPDLLKVGREDIRSIVLKDYALDDQQRVVATATGLVRADAAADWTSEQAPADKRVAKTAVDKLLTELTGLRLAGIRPLNPNWLEPRGFFLVPDPALLQDPNTLVLNTNRGKAALVGSQGGIAITTKDGVRYQCFFGEIAVGDEDDTEAEVKKPEKKEGATAEGHNRYMVVFVQYDPKADDDTRKKAEDDAKKAAEKKDGDAAKDEKKDEKKDATPAGKTRADKAQKKFAQFFYVISDKSFNELRPKPETLYEAKPAEPMAGTTGKTVKQWLDENAKKPGVTATGSGLQYEVVEASTQADAKQPKDGDTVQVQYRGTLVDGTEFDASKGAPASFNVNGVIKGWTEALKLMKEGDHWRLAIPPELGYGEAGSPPKIGANQILIFDVTLVKVGS